MQLLVTKEDAGRPLYLAISCEELRVFGEFRKLTSKIQCLPGDLSGVIEIVLNRIIKEYGGDKVLSTLCLIETSRFGLSEAELVQLLAVEPLIPSSSSNTAPIQFTGQKIHMAEWAFVYLGLHQFLRPCGGGSDDGRLDFYHRTSSKVVRQVFLKDEATKVAYHKRLAAFFKQCKDIARKCEELPYHLLSAQDKTELRAVLTDRAVFEHMSQDKHKQYLMKTWQQLGGYTEAAAAYTNFLKEHIEVGETTLYTDFLHEYIEGG
ncbi:telomerase protein component 1-like [Haliotis cracherodii]|uniref:telomerase protein component 1-like n=1 Tax=Haliotis cracherodii TaxID=6455 RepID=UPI0039E87212